MVGFLGLGASLDLLARFGLTAEYSPIAEGVVALNRIAAERLQAIGAVIKSRLEPRHASGILSFDLPGRDLRAVRKRCLEADVVLSLRNGWLRISPHAYCDEDDIERLIEAIQRACGR
jgi:selenocysteine lyase/cysteine desulfurase